MQSGMIQADLIFFATDSDLEGQFAKKNLIEYKVYKNVSRYDKTGQGISIHGGWWHTEWDDTG